MIITVFCLAAWMYWGFAFNLACFILLEYKLNKEYFLLSILLSWIGIFGIFNLIGLSLIEITDIIFFSKTFEKFQDNFFKYIYL